jgi:hypothetical protein
VDSDIAAFVASNEYPFNASANLKAIVASSPAPSPNPVFDSFNNVLSIVFVTPKDSPTVFSCYI